VGHTCGRAHILGRRYPKEASHARISRRTPDPLRGRPSGHPGRRLGRPARDDRLAARRTDLAPLLKGLPNDLCPCPHWIYVIKGRSRVTYADGSEEIQKAGDLCYLPPGHTAVIEEDIEFVEFSRPAEIQPVLDHVARVAAAT
jgi:hypothetical protein